jgi:outer membrane protein OmpA-like peptidoglycan-associated protein
MKLRLTRLAMATGFAFTLLLATASCSHQPHTADAPTPTIAAQVRPAPLRIAQMSFGPNAYFAACAEPACPSPTPKTLPGTVARPVVAAASEVVGQRLPAPAAADSPRTEEPDRPLTASASRDPSAADTHILLTFAFGSAALTTESRQVLRRSLRLARESDRIVISGRTDSVGPEEFNQQLALARAMAVRNFIRDAVPDLPNVIAIDAKGRCCFIASNDDEGGRSRNRRVEVVFTSSGVM